MIRYCPKDGTLILRLQETANQTRNIMTATRVALPHIVCSTLRRHIDPYAESAIDLTLLRKLAERLGRHARPVFQRYFLEPEIEKDNRVEALLQKLISLNDTGLFVTVFLGELSTLADYLYNSVAKVDYTDELVALLEFLLVVAQREEHSEIPLIYHSRNLHTGIILLAYHSACEVRGGCSLYPKNRQRH